MGPSCRAPVVSFSRTARMPLSQLLPRYEAIPAAWRLSHHVAFVHEHQVVACEIVEPFLPRDWPELRGPGEVEPYTRAAVADVDRRRPRFGSLSRGRLRSALGGPFANELAVVGG